MDGQCLPAIAVQCAVEPEVSMYFYIYWGRTVGGTAQRRTLPKRKKRTPSTRREPKEAREKDEEPNTQ